MKNLPHKIFAFVAAAGIFAAAIPSIAEGGVIVKPRQPEKKAAPAKTPTPAKAPAKAPASRGNKALAARCFGKIRVVNIGEDFKVRVVNVGEDLRVQRVKIAPNGPGKWQYVNIGEDYKVRFVDIGEDFTIRFVEINPGI